MSGDPMIGFTIHEFRAGLAGAGADFEQMLGQLVRATGHGEARMIFANPGDWGIDVLDGDLSGRVTIWQAKYFVRGFGKAQQSQVRESFASALKHAAEHGYEIDRWVLCIPTSMDGPATRWWQRWQADNQQRAGLRVELWDESTLRALLLRPEAADIRQHYYNPYRDHDPAGAKASLAPRSAPVQLTDLEAEPAWTGGAEFRLDGSVYLLHDEPSERASLDRSWTWQEATAELIEPGAGRVRIRRVKITRRIASAEQQYSGLLSQARLLKALDGRAGLPRLLGTTTRPAEATIITAHPPGSSWAEALGPGPGPADRITAARTLAAAAEVCASLSVLHERGASHRALHPAAIFVQGGRCFLRDAGLTEIPPATGEGRAGLPGS